MLQAYFFLFCSRKSAGVFVPAFDKIRHFKLIGNCLIAAALTACGGGSEVASSVSSAVSNNSSGSTSIVVVDPSLQALGPNVLGQAPNVDGYYPNAAGLYPNAQGIYPGTDGSYPTAEQAGWYANEHGAARNYSSTGKLDRSNAFFKPFGNGRSCVSCHQPADGFSLRPDSVQKRFTNSAGTDPLFSLNDGANSPRAEVKTLEDRFSAYSMLLTKGLIRVGMKIPSNAEFELLQADDPYRFASASELSLFRRPLPAANLNFLSDVMWDGRDNLIQPSASNCVSKTLCFASLESNLARQANNATLGHAQAAKDLTVEEQAEIVAFEKTLVSAQVFSSSAGFLDVAGALGGGENLQKIPFYFGMNDVDLGNLKTGASFDRITMKNFTAWLTRTGTLDVKMDAARKSIARGELLFNTRTFNPQNNLNIQNDLKISLNRMTCSSCHNTPGAGSASTPLRVSIFTSDANLRTADMPLYTLRNKLTGNVTKTTDPGVAMQTGKWEDIGRFKVPTLRGLSGRAPYFHNGAAESLLDVVAYYDRTFAINLSGQELIDLAAFLSAL